MNTFTFIIVVVTILQVLFMGLKWVIKSFNEWGKNDLNYYKTQSDYNFLRRNAYVNLSLFIVVVLLQSVVIYHLYKTLL